MKRNTMKTTNLILLSIFICVGGIVFFFACKYTYVLKVAQLEEKAKEALIQALEKEVKNRNVNGNFSFGFNARSILTTDMPDSVYVQDASGKYAYWLDPDKVRMNITPDANVRVVHSYIFSKLPLQPDSLHAAWTEYLSQANISCQSAVHISVTDKYGKTQSEYTCQEKWCNSSNLVVKFYLGYACEIEVLAYIHYSIWHIMYPQILFYLLLFILIIGALYKKGSIVLEKYCPNHKKNSRGTDYHSSK